MKILHTADWHLGQLFYEYDRTAEHQHFLEWLSATLTEQQIEVLLISGDVFDVTNPSVNSIRLLYGFLNKVSQQSPHLQIVITAGNHDSASRLEAPIPLLQSTNIHIVGTIDKLLDGSINYQKLCIPLKNKAGIIQTWCLAIPFIRLGDYPQSATQQYSYAEGVAQLYHEAYEYANARKEHGQNIIAMGHLHTFQAEELDMDKSERMIMGGSEFIAATAFHSDLKYVALGHIHKAQRIGGKDHIRYSGSPLPMSFSERNYKHQVVIFDLDEEIKSIECAEIPVSIPLLRVPLQPLPLEEVIALLHKLPVKETTSDTAPYLEVQVLLLEPEPSLRYKIETVIASKNVRLARIQPHYVQNSTHLAATAQHDLLNDLNPTEVFVQTYQSKFQSEVPHTILDLFKQTLQEVYLNDE